MKINAFFTIFKTKSERYYFRNRRLLKNQVVDLINYFSEKFGINIFITTCRRTAARLFNIDIVKPEFFYCYLETEGIRTDPALRNSIIK